MSERATTTLNGLESAYNDMATAAQKLQDVAISCSKNMRESCKSDVGEYSMSTKMKAFDSAYKTYNDMITKISTDVSNFTTTTAAPTTTVDRTTTTKARTTTDSGTTTKARTTTDAGKTSKARTTTDSGTTTKARTTTDSGTASKKGGRRKHRTRRRH